MSGANELGPQDVVVPAVGPSQDLVATPVKWRPPKNPIFERDRRRYADDTSGPGTQRPGAAASATSGLSRPVSTRLAPGRAGRCMPAGFGGRLRGKGPRQRAARDLAAQPTLSLVLSATENHLVGVEQGARGVHAICACNVPGRQSLARGHAIAMIRLGWSVNQTLGALCELMCLLTMRHSPGLIRRVQA